MHTESFPITRYGSSWTMKATDAESRLSHLLTMEQAEIDADLAEYQGRLADLIEEIQSLLHPPREQRTAAVEARVAHLRMIQAHLLCREETLSPDVKTFYAALGTEKIAHDAGFAASSKGTVAQLSNQMEEIKRRENLPAGEWWMQGEVPEDYRQLAARQEAMLDDIEQTITAFLLRRYHLTEYAELYEADRVTFEIEREVGRIIMMEGGVPPAENDLMRGYIGIRFGLSAVQRVLARLHEIRHAA